MSSRLTMRIATHALIAGLALSTSGVAAVNFAAPALAQESTSDAASAENASVAAQAADPTSHAIDVNHATTLTIHKRASDDPDAWGKPNGEEVDNPAGDPLAGATFSVQKLNFDFSQPEQIAQAAKLTAVTAKDHIDTNTAAVTKVTDSDGKAVFSDLGVGAFLVTETEAPEGKIPASPFVVFLPMTNPTRTGWNYDVHAYPKNTKVDLAKALSTVLPEGNAKANQDANVGDEISYDITAGRPIINKDNTYVKFFQVYDRVPAGLTYVDDAAKRKLTIGGTALEESDYTVTQGELNGDSYVYYTLTKSGNEKLTNAGKDDKVVGTFTFTIDKLPEADKGKTLTNKGGAIQETGPKVPVDPNDPDGPKEIPTDPTEYPDPDPSTPPSTPDPNKPGNETPGVDVTLITVEFKKTDPDGKALQGATFNVYRCTKPGAAEGLDKGSVKATLGDRVLSGQGDFVSGEDGKVTLNALRLREDAVRTDDGGYCLVETKAPQNFELLPSPYFFRVSMDDKARTKEFNFEITNNRTVGPKLPSTGGMGVGLIMGLGIVIVGAGVVVGRRNSRRDS